MENTNLNISPYVPDWHVGITPIHLSKEETNLLLKAIRNIESKKGVGYNPSEEELNTEILRITN